MRIVFLGNPEFARFHLETIVEEGFNVVGVVSAMDKPAGRGLKLRGTPVAEYAREKNIPLLQPKNLKNEEFLKELANLKADIQIVIAFRMLPEVVWNMPPLGTLNLHASLLPQYRGAAPINWAIINGEQHTGVTTFKLKHEIDTGDILLQESCDISSDDTAGSLHDKLMHLGAQVTVKTLNGIIAGNLKEQPQKTVDNIISAPKLFTENTKIDFSQKANQIRNFVRGLCPYPVAHMQLNGLRLRVFEVDYELISHKHSPATIVSDSKNYLKVACEDGFVILKDVQLQGKKRMGIEDFLRGYKGKLGND
ncbi:MAG: methionyl-tRNA formyltransferase [Bacteroidia bacterium]